MPHDLFDELADRRVPPPPTDLARDVHLRLNRTLVLLHVVEFVVRVVPYCLKCFVAGVLSLCQFTFTGRHAVDRSRRSPDDDRPN